MRIHPSRKPSSRVRQPSARKRQRGRPEHRLRLGPDRSPDRSSGRSIHRSLHPGTADRGWRHGRSFNPPDEAQRLTARSRSRNRRNRLLPRLRSLPIGGTRVLRHRKARRCSSPTAWKSPFRMSPQDYRRRPSRVLLRQPFWNPAGSRLQLPGNPGRSRLPASKPPGIRIWERFLRLR